MELLDHVNYYTYPAFMELMEKLVAEGGATGAVKNADFIFWTKLSLQRLNRWQKTLTISDEAIAAAEQAEPQVWWIITGIVVRRCLADPARDGEDERGLKRPHRTAPDIPRRQPACDGPVPYRHQPQHTHSDSREQRHG